MPGKPRREGYLLIDHTFSPGVTPEQLHAAGAQGPAVGKDRKGEFATVTCLHCGTVVILNPMRTRSRGYCARCDGYVCDNPACGMECRPLEKVFDFVQDQNARAEEKGLPVAGLPDLSPLLTRVSATIPVSPPAPKEG